MFVINITYILNQFYQNNFQNNGFLSISVSNPYWLHIYIQSYFRQIVVYKIVGRRMVTTEVSVLQMMPKNAGAIALTMKILPKI